MSPRPDEIWTIVAIVLGAVGTYLLLPHRHGRLRPRPAHIVGGVLAAAAILLLAMTWAPMGVWLERAFFYAFGLASLAGAVMMITSKNPVYAALWFAAVVLSTSGLFLLAGAQFLAAGTVIVYAGAIIVTFLFVIMLAQAEGQAVYDRAARGPGRATVTCFLLLWSLAYALLHVRTPADQTGVPAPPEARLVSATSFQRFYRLRESDPKAVALSRAVSPAARLSAPHVAGLGGTLFTDHLIAVEVTGAILFVALVGAAAIATPRPPVRPVAAGTALGGGVEPLLENLSHPS